LTRRSSGAPSAVRWLLFAAGAPSACSCGEPAFPRDELRSVVRHARRDPMGHRVIHADRSVGHEGDSQQITLRRDGVLRYESFPRGGPYRRCFAKLSAEEAAEWLDASPELAAEDPSGSDLVNESWSFYSSTTPADETPILGPHAVRLRRLATRWLVEHEAGKQPSKCESLELSELVD